MIPASTWRRCIWLPPSATVEARLLALARANGRAVVADKPSYIFGIVNCPRCHVSCEIPQMLT